jgi:hypothetical protein
MISAETRAQIRQWFFAEHWKIGTIAQALRIHPDTVRGAIESDGFHRAQTLRACVTDPYLPFIRQTLDQHSRLRATRIYHMIRDRGYQGSIVQLRRAVAILRPIRREPFLRLHAFPATKRIHSIEISACRIRGSNEIAYLTAHYKTTFSSPEQSAPKQLLGSHLWILEKHNGKWLVTLVSWSVLR